MTGLAALNGEAVRVALVGAGAVARRHADVLTSLGARIAAIADPAAARARELAETYDAQAFGTVGRALAAVEVDAVYVCVPPFAHGEPEREAVAHGLPLFVEKPLAVDLATAEQIAADIARARVVTGTGYHWRCLDTLPRARRLLWGAPVVLATGTWVGSRPPPAWWSHHSLGGGQVVEQLTHLLDLARVLLGEPEEVHAASVRRVGGHLANPGDAPDASDAVDDATAATVRFSSGAVATFATSSVLDAPHDVSLRLVAPGVALTLTEDCLRVTGQGEQIACPTHEDPRVAVDRDFLEVVRGDRQATVAPYDDVLATHRLGCAITTAARTGRSIRFDRPPWSGR